MNSKTTATTKNSTNYLLSDIIPEKKFNNLSENNIILASDLERLINNKEKNIISYSNRFCVITKNNFSYYSSKESFIRLKPPLFFINNNEIIRIEKTVINDYINNYYFCIIFNINQDNIDLINNINTFYIENNNENNIKEAMIGFKSEDKNLINKWITILNYFININNNNNNINNNSNNKININF